MITGMLRSCPWGKLPGVGGFFANQRAPCFLAVAKVRAEVGIIPALCGFPSGNGIQPRASSVFLESRQLSRLSKSGKKPREPESLTTTEA